MNKASKEVRALSRLAGQVAAEASLDGLDARTAVMAAAIHVSFGPEMKFRDIADWLRRFADLMEADARNEFAAEVRRLMKDN